MQSKIYFSWEQIQKQTLREAPNIKEQFNPEVIIALGGGGVIPARILREYLDLPMFYIGIQLYDKDGKQFKDGPKKFQWLGENELEFLKGKRILLVDEVYDSGTSIRYCLSELKSIGIENVKTFVVFEKYDTKKSDILDFYSASVDLKDWIVFPWEDLKPRNIIVCVYSMPTDDTTGNILLVWCEIGRSSCYITFFKDGTFRSELVCKNQKTSDFKLHAKTELRTDAEDMARELKEFGLEVDDVLYNVNK